MAYQVDISTEAEGDIDEIYEWTRGRWSDDQADRYVTSLESAILGLAETPERYPIAQEYPRLGANVRRMVFGTGRNNYKLYFRIDGTHAVRVLAVYHSSREPISGDPN